MWFAFEIFLAELFGSFTVWTSTSLAVFHRRIPLFRLFRCFFFLSFQIVALGMNTPYDNYGMLVCTYVH